MAGIVQGTIQLDGGFGEVAGIGIEDGHGDGKGVLGVVFPGIHDGVVFKEFDGVSGGGLAQDKDFREGGDHCVRFFFPHGVGGGGRRREVAPGIEGIGKTLGQGEGVIVVEGFGAAGERFGVFPGGEDVEGYHRQGGEDNAQCTMQNAQPGGAEAPSGGVQKGKEGEG